MEVNAREKEEILKKIKSSYAKSNTYCSPHHSRILNYRSYYSDAEKENPIRKNEKNKSRYRSKLIQKKIIKQHAELSEPILSDSRLFSINNSTESRYIGRILNFQWNNLVGKDLFVDSLISNYTIDGTAIAKIEWQVEVKKIKRTIVSPVISESKEDVMEFVKTLDEERANKIINIFNETGKGISGEIKEEYFDNTVVRNQPKLKSVNPMSIFIPNGIYDQDSIPYIIEEYEMTFLDIIRNRHLYIDSNKCIIDAIRQDQALSSIYSGELLMIPQDSEVGDYVESLVLNNEDLHLKKVIVREFWGSITTSGGQQTPIVAAWINDTLIRYEKSPYKHGMLPYAFASINPSNDSLFGKADSAIMINDQIGFNRIMRVLDNSSIDAEKDQRLIQSGIFTDNTQMRNFKKGEDAYIRKDIDPSKAIFSFSLTPLPESVSFLKDTYQNELNSVYLPNQPMLSNSNGIDKQDPIDDLVSSRLRRLMSLLSRVGTLMTSMNSQFLLSTDKLVNDDEEIGIDPRRLNSDGSITFASTMSNRQNEIEANRILRLMDSRGANMTEDIASMHYIEIAELWKKYKFADKLKDEMDKPKEPDPVQEMQLKQMEIDIEKTKLEIAKVEAEAKYYMMRAEEQKSKAFKTYNDVASGITESEAMLNYNRAELAYSQVGKFNAQTDMFRQEFNMVDSGLRREMDKEDMEYQHGSNLEREKIRTDREIELNQRKHENAKKEKEVESKKESSPLSDYILNGTIENSTFDAADDVYRNILNKNSIDGEKYYKGKENANI